MPSREPGERWDCQACGRQLVGAMTMAGKTAPIEVMPNPAGNVLLQKHGSILVGITMGGPLLDLAKEAGVQLRYNHFASCESADRFRTPDNTPTADDAPSDGAIQ